MKGKETPITRFLKDLARPDVLKKLESRAKQLREENLEKRTENPEENTGRTHKVIISSGGGMPFGGPASYTGFRLYLNIFGDYDDCSGRFFRAIERFLYY